MTQETTAPAPALPGRPWLWSQHPRLHTLVFSLCLRGAETQDRPRPCVLGDAPMPLGANFNSWANRDPSDPDPSRPCAQLPAKCRGVDRTGHS